MFAQNKKMFQKFFFTISLLSLCSNCFGQNDSLIMDGSLSVSKAGTFKYKVVIGEKNGKWNGYTILDAGGPNETKSTVSVHFLKDKEAMALAEKSLVSTKSKEKSFCFVGGLLKMNDKKSQAKGYFLGQDEKKKMCGSGTVKLNLPEKAKILMTPDGTKDTNISAIVTSQNSESFTVKSGEIKLEVWDGGLSDQDSLSISVNNELAVAAFQITNEKKIISIKLKKGENIIKIKALNEGLEPPNSARFMVLDENSRYPIVSFLKKNEEATLKIKW